MNTLLLLAAAWLLLKPKKPAEPRGELEIGEPTIGSPVTQWQQPFPDRSRETWWREGGEA